MRGLPLAALAFLACLLLPPAPAAAADGRRLIVLGVDGMDPVLLRQFMAEGVVPNLQKLAGQGGFRTLGTSTPPQSPVAWSDFITGMDSGGHGIFDFVALDRQTLSPYLSASRVDRPSRKPLKLGRWRIPLGTERTVLLRHGQAFWEVLDDSGVAATLFQVPANYPPVQAGRGSLSGMGTPDLRGTPGTFSYFTDDPALRPGDVSGGVIRRVRMADGVIRGQLDGVVNALLEGAPMAVTPFEVRVDPVNPVALVEFAEARALLKVGEWSGWLPVRFELAPGLAPVTGMVRLYLQRTTPWFGLYMSPVNIDPRDPAQPIAYPPGYATELAKAAGPFYTEEMPEDTKALSAGVFSAQEFLAQSDLVMDERRRLLRYELDRFRQAPAPGFLFFYLSTVDQRHHMLSRQMEAGPADLAGAMRRTYRDIDEMVGWIQASLGAGTTLIVMSDHGFAPFRTQAHLNTWLEQNGYLVLKDPARRAQVEWLDGIDWSRTRAFAIGLNSLYINVRGREREGIVAPADRRALAREIADRLGTWRDPATGQPVVTQPLLREDAYRGQYVEQAPDVIVGYASGYRASWSSSTGGVGSRLLEPNDAAWSGDHCMDSRVVPGVLLANRKLRAVDSNLRDLPVTILRYFGIDPPAQMTGHSVF